MMKKKDKILYRLKTKYHIDELKNNLIDWKNKFFNHKFLFNGEYNALQTDTWKTKYNIYSMLRINIKSLFNNAKLHPDLVKK